MCVLSGWTVGEIENIEMNFNAEFILVYLSLKIKRRADIIK